MRVILVASILPMACLASACATAPSPNVAANDEVRCVERLVPNSNTHLTYCGTEAQWRELERRESLAAQASTETLQGGAYGTAGY